MDFEKYLSEQIEKHPSFQPQDVIKLCFQAAFGAEHLLEDPQKAEACMKKEFDAISPQDIPLYEQISDKTCRINLAAWKFHALPADWLFQIFLSSISERKETTIPFQDYLNAADAVLHQVKIPFTLEKWQEYVRSYLENGIRPVHHSQQYREQENPAYRIIDTAYIPLLPILQKISEKQDENKTCVISIDGRAASGKTTLTERLKAILKADVVQMDDFFLPLNLRTEERFRMPGGNVHHERFCEEVLPFIRKKEVFSYRIFDCSQMDYNGEKIIGNSAFRIVEGSYSQHPLFGDYADITVFSDINADEQMQRILKRNGPEMARMFEKRWIPLEESYFQAYSISEKAHLIYKTS